MKFIQYWRVGVYVNIIFWRRISSQTHLFFWYLVCAVPNVSNPYVAFGNWHVRRTFSFNSLLSLFSKYCMLFSACTAIVWLANWQYNNRVFQVALCLRVYSGGDSTVSPQAMVVVQHETPPGSVSRVQGGIQAETTRREEDARCSTGESGGTRISRGILICLVVVQNDQHYQQHTQSTLFCDPPPSLLQKEYFENVDF